MSRIGRMPIGYTDKVAIEIDNNNNVTVTGPKGKLTRAFNKNINIEVNKEESKIVVTRPNDQKENRALHGLTRALLNNMVKGVTDGFQKGLDIVGVGYRAQLQGKKLVLTVGYSHPVEIEEVPGITYELPTPNKILVKGMDKEVVGQVCAKIRDIRRPEPYKGKGIRYENEVVRIKEGKTGKK